MHKKYHKKFKILDIPAVTTQAREGIETPSPVNHPTKSLVTTQAREGIETSQQCSQSPWQHVTTQAHEGIETILQSAFRVAESS